MSRGGIIQKSRVKTLAINSVRKPKLSILFALIPMTQLIGYARVSSVSQNLDAQLDQLKQAGILYQNSDKSAREVCELFGFSRRTLFSYMKSHKTP